MRNASSASSGIAVASPRDKEPRQDFLANIAMAFGPVESQHREKGWNMPVGKSARPFGRALFILILVDKF